jgi:biotin-(acetyl-CoA carboxylase) ligase
VNTTPKVEPTLFVPDVTSLFDCSSNNKKLDLSIIFDNLIQFLEQNYNLLLSNQFHHLLDFYRQRSHIIGKSVKILSDTLPYQNQEIARGKAESIGENLELFLENLKSPITKGRLILEE